MADVALLINDNLYGGWVSVSIDLSIEALSGTFNLSLTDKWAGQVNPTLIKPGDACLLLIDNKTVITGYVDSVAISIDSNSHSITVIGRDKACDLIDCSVINGTGQYQNLKVEQIVTRICELFGIKVTCDIDTGEPLKTFNIEQGSPAIDAIQKLCYARQCLAMSDGLGGVLITRAGNNKSDSQLVEGTNILTGSANYDYSQRFSHYIVKGQQQGADTLSPESTAANIAIAQDVNVPRFRPYTIVADGQATGADCDKRANWELNTRKGRSRRFSIATVGWLQESGALWALNELVFLQSDALGVYDELLVAGINFSMSDAGQITTLSLTARDAYLTLETNSLDSKSNPYMLDEVAEA